MASEPFAARALLSGLEMLGERIAWETMIERCHNGITKEAIAEALKLSGEALLKRADEA